MDIIHYNAQAWDKQVEQGNTWTQAVDSKTIEQARIGKWQIVLTPTRPVPLSWFGTADGLLSGRRILCLASGGGQQAPVLAAAGAEVTTLDNSLKQLERDREVAEREGLQINLVRGDMADLSDFEDESFDLVFNPCSICFSPDPRRVWQEACRVLKPDGHLMTGIANPVLYLFDDEELNEGRLVVRYSIPFSDEAQLDDRQKQRFIDAGEPFAFGHSWDDLLGGMIDAGFVIDGFFEDGFDAGPYEHLNRTIQTFAAVRGRKH